MERIKIHTMVVHVMFIMIAVSFVVLGAVGHTVLFSKYRSTILTKTHSRHIEFAITKTVVHPCPGLYFDP